MGIQGFLIVPVEKEGPLEPDPNQLYQGVGRLPAQPSDFEEESEALEEYVFGDYVDDDATVIPTLQKARELLFLFANSPRDFEILYCEADVFADDLEDEAEYRLLGFDVAGITGDCWSIVDDFPPEQQFRR